MIMTDFETWLLDYGSERIFRMIELRGVDGSTPREMEQKYISPNRYYDLIKIVEIIELPDKDILIGYKLVFEWDDMGSEEWDKKSIHYRKLSQIELSFCPEDIRGDD